VGFNSTEKDIKEIDANNVSSAFNAYHELNKQYVPILEKRSANFTPIDIEPPDGLPTVKDLEVSVMKREIK
jgi:hypothetical protein